MMAVSTFSTRKSPLLDKGDTIGVFAPGSPAKPERLRAGYATLSNLGFVVAAPLDPSAFYGDYTHGFASASARDRASTLRTLLKDPDVRAIICARGAYGTLDILPFLDYEELALYPKVVVGYSDVTALLVSLWSRCRFPSVHGATVSGEFADYGASGEAQTSVDTLLEMLRSPHFEFTASCDPIVSGNSEGWLLPGNLTMLQTLLGTPWDLDYDGAILVIEEVGEAPYRVHRALTQLHLAGKLKKLNGVVFGRFSKCVAAHGPTVDDVLESCASEYFPQIPVFKNFSFGHHGTNIPVPIGCRAEMQQGVLRLLESPVA